MALVVISLAACDINAPKVATVVVTVPPAPTITLAPIITATLRYTATPIPTSTFIPTATLPPTATIPPVTVVASPTPNLAGSVRGSVNFNIPSVNVRNGPSLNAKSLTQVAAGGSLAIVGFSDDKQWYFVTLDDGTEGWISSDFVTVSNPTLVAVVSTADLTRRAQQPEPVVTGGTVVATLRARNVGRNDVLAYCDLPDFRKTDAGKSFPKTTAINVYWSWYAKTPEQVQDHLDHAVYEVSLDVQSGENWNAVRKFDNWRTYQTGVVKQSGKYYVYWFIPLDMLDVGQYRVNYKLTWTQRISDGDKTFGPGGDEEVNTGSCLFSVK